MIIPAVKSPTLKGPELLARFEYHLFLKHAEIGQLHFSGAGEAAPPRRNRKHNW